MPETNPILNRFIEANTSFVHALALRLAPAPGLAEDIAQQVIVQSAELIPHLHALPPPGANR